MTKAYIVVGNINAVSCPEDASIVGIFLDRASAEGAAMKHAQQNDLTDHPISCFADVIGYVITEIVIGEIAECDAVWGSLKVRDLAAG